MSFLKKLSNFFSSSGNPNTMWVTARCKRCGEVVRTRINLNNDLSQDYADGNTVFFCRKVLMGDERCFQRIEVELTFDANKRLQNRKISGGEFVDEPQS